MALAESPLQMRFTVSVSVFCAVLLRAATQLNAQQFRPALIGSGPGAAINLVNTKKLMDGGQKDAVVMFSRFVLTTNFGHVGATEITYASADSQLFQDEVVRALNVSNFSPALVDGQRTAVTFYGTATFAIKDGKPHLRIFANQELDEIAAGHDFIAPQPIAEGPKWRETAANLLNVAIAKHIKGAAIVSVSVDTAGKPSNVKIISENPAGLNFGAAAAKITREGKFIPGFRNGKAVACSVKIRQAFLIQ
jgi:hypothetical protein